MKNPHLLLTLNLVSAPFEKPKVTCSSARNAAHYIRKPWDVAEDCENNHVVMYAFYSRMLEPRAQVVEILAESDFAHDIKTE